MSTARHKRQLKDLSAEVARLHRQTVPSTNPQDSEEFKESLKRSEMISRWVQTNDPNDLPEEMREYAPVFEQLFQDLEARNEPNATPQTNRIETLVAVLDAVSSPPPIEAGPSTTPPSTTTTRPPPVEPPAAVPTPAPRPAQTPTPTAAPAARESVPQRLIPPLWE